MHTSPPPRTHAVHLFPARTLPIPYYPSNRFPPLPRSYLIRQNHHTSADASLLANDFADEDGAFDASVEGDQFARLHHKKKTLKDVLGGEPDPNDPFGLREPVKPPSPPPTLASSRPIIDPLLGRPIGHLGMALFQFRDIEEGEVQPLEVHVTREERQNVRRRQKMAMDDWFKGRKQLKETRDQIKESVLSRVGLGKSPRRSPRSWRRGRDAAKRREEHSKAHGGRANSAEHKAAELAREREQAVKQAVVGLEMAIEMQSIPLLENSMKGLVILAVEGPLPERATELLQQGQELLAALAKEELRLKWLAVLSTQKIRIVDLVRKWGADLTLLPDLTLRFASLPFPSLPFPSFPLPSPPFPYHTLLTSGAEVGPQQ